MDDLSPAEKYPVALAWSYLYVVYGVMLGITLYVSVVLPPLAIPLGIMAAAGGFFLSRWFQDKMRKIEEQ